jgi:hypothetical protein
MDPRKKLFLTLIILISIIIAFRGRIFRNLIDYETSGFRKNHPISNVKLKNEIDNRLVGLTNPDIEEILKISQSLTSATLHFKFDKTEINPNRLIYSKNSHCVGYSSFLTTTCNYILNKYNLNHKWKAKHCFGYLKIGGMNIHKYFSLPFYKDHDFVVIENLETKEFIAVDPVINDYLRIDFITLSK